MHTELSGDGAGVLGRVTVTRDRSFDSFARPRESGVRNCELAVRSGGSALRGFFLQGSRALPDKIWGAPVAVEPESEGMRAKKPPQRGAARRSI